jgi:hypothetical protein
LQGDRKQSARWPRGQPGGGGGGGGESEGGGGGGGGRARVVLCSEDISVVIDLSVALTIIEMYLNFESLRGAAV